MKCPWDGCEYTSDSDLGIQQHHKRTHGVSLTEVKLECDWCDEGFTRQRSRDKRFDGTFCSVECRRNANAKSQRKVTTHICEYCDSEFTLTGRERGPRNKRFCGHNCYHEHLTTINGEDHPLYEGESETNYGPLWQLRRIEAIERDNYVCQDCGMTREEHREIYDVDFDVHHIEPYSSFTFNVLAHRLDNLVTLCKSCHVKRENQ